MELLWQLWNIFKKEKNKIDNANPTLQLFKPPQISYINLHKFFINLQSTSYCSQILQIQANNQDQIYLFHVLLKQEINCDTKRDPNIVDVM
jgi:hypothetical protein